MKATINGQARELPGGITVGELLELLGTARTGIAIACNDAVIRRAQFDEYQLADGDRVEIIKAVAGG
jgi:sulfur carrier protein